MTDFSQNQKIFASALSSALKWDPNAVKAWLLAEEPAGATQRVGADRVGAPQDWLNVGITDSGPRGAGNPVWNDPTTAAQETAKWALGQESLPGFGKADSRITSAITSTQGKGAQAELAAIAGSPWASGGYGGAGALQSLLSSVSGIKLPTSTTGVTGATTTQIPSLQKVGNVSVAQAPAAAAAAIGPNVFDTLSGLEKSREAALGQSNGAGAGGWDALSTLYDQQQAAKAPVVAPTVTNPTQAKLPTPTNVVSTKAPSTPSNITSAKGITTPQAAWNPNGKPVANWIAPILAAAAAAGVKFTLSSGYRSDAEQTRIYNSGVRPAAVPKSLGGSGSNHEGDTFPEGAVDIGSGQAALAAWLEKSPYKGLLVYAGSKDQVHFSHPHDGGY